MPSIMPQEELVRRAAAWVCAELASGTCSRGRNLLDEAGMRYNLSPKECLMLADLFAESILPTAPANARRPD